MNYLLDTNAVSEWTKPAPDAGLTAWLAAVSEERVFLSVITLAEIKFGIERLMPGHHRGALEKWLAEELIPRFDGRLLPVDAEVANRWGEIAAAGAALGRPIAIMDGFIASIASVHDLTLVTRNVSHFANTGIGTVNSWTGDGSGV
jgi:toxin FitB